MEDVDVFDKLGKNAKTPLGGLVEQNIGRFGIAHRDNADFARFDLEDCLDGPLQGMLQRDNTFGLQPQRLDRLDVEGIGQVRGHELHPAERLGDVAACFRQRAAPVAGNHADGETFRFLRPPLAC